jgi:alkylation response protein AidB-like acyl-CoA dehydrogenase
MTDIRLRIHRETASIAALRSQVREFLADARQRGVYEPAVDTWLTGWSAEFSKLLARQGWIGMTLPRAYGGHGRSHLERFAVTEELLAGGAPIAAHWIADRQSGPSILKFGTEAQKQRYLPRIAAGEMFFAIGMSEPETGSDLASVRMRGDRVDGGWTLAGSKIWTSGAHLADAILLLARTEPLDAGRRHAGLTQFIVDLRAPGVDVRPIRSMSGEAHFNEVFFDSVFVPDEDVLGEPGSGWEQVTAELALERSGPERVLSTFQVLDALAASGAAGELDLGPEYGSAVARVAALHTMSLGIAGMLARGDDVDTGAAFVKVMGTSTEGDIAGLGAEITATGRLHNERLGLAAELADAAIVARPGFTLRGGTNEVLRGVIARGLGMR